ncbi:single stranded DNA-binding protein [Methanococcus maripaludis]|uniref:Single stranded DNA-binding protein n=1 Tax=Methanococcus maripaludis TaxID=39152 RepID=A0A7J9NVJ6_METMI|nr:single-stranded DNA-binding protein [Methanococcus maripaludis]MBA2851700.1 single stranded DNA-binding protein [Methanococcus maripaludis]
MQVFMGEGRPTADPVKGENGKPTTFTIAINRSYKDKNTNKYEADFFEVVAFGELGALIANLAKKGKMCSVIGEVHNDRWTDKQTGAPRQTTKIYANKFLLLDRSE